jgi:hypothetical protein
MSVIDKVVNEWAFRCKKGYPDMNNPADMKILKEIYSQFGIVTEEEAPKEGENNKTLDDILNLIRVKKGEFKQEQLNKLYDIIEKTGKGYTTSLLQKLQQKKLGDEQSRIVAGYADQNHFEDKLVASIDNKQNTFAALGRDGNLSTKLTELSGIDSKYVNRLIGFVTGKGNVSVGRGELALVALLADTVSADKGDVGIEYGAKTVEIKASTKRAKGGLSGAILAPKSVTDRGSKVEVIKQRVSKHFSEEDAKSYIEAGSTPWTQAIYNYYIFKMENSEDKAKTKQQFLKELKSALQDIYGNTVTLEDSDLDSLALLQIRIAKGLAKAYMKEIGGQPIMFISDNLDYTIAESEKYLESIIGTKVKIVGFSDYTPRLSFEGAPAEAPVT